MFLLTLRTMMKTQKVYNRTDRVKDLKGELSFLV
jgi:hypothetical protein